MVTKLTPHAIHTYFPAFCRNRFVYVLHLGAWRIPTVMNFWFAWYAFHPKTSVYVLKD
jgi:hypothetical protein